MHPAEFVVVIGVSCSVTSAAFLALRGRHFVLNGVSHSPVVNTPLHGISVIVPSLGGGKQLDACLGALKKNMPGLTKRVIVILQQFSEPISAEIRSSWCSPVELVVCEMKGNPSKAAAISLGLQSVETDWVLMLDSDAQATSHIYRLFESLNDTDAVYGLIVPVERPPDTILVRIVKTDKVVSHGVWRLGRYAAGLWPNIPGQCYAIRTNLLRAIYDEKMGHLDDMAVTLGLASLHGRVKFVPAIVCREEGRATWFGLFSQRARWWIGLLQTLGKLRFHSGNLLAPVACWTIHAWLYFGWPLFTSAMGATFWILGRPCWALGTAISFLITWSLLAIAGNRIFTHVHPAYAPVAFATTAFPASCLILLAQTVGFLAAPVFVLVSVVRPLFGISLLYRR